MLVATHFLFGTTFACNKFVFNQQVNPVLHSFNRVAIAALLLWPFYLRLQHTARWTPGEWRWAAIVAFLIQPLAMILEYTGAKYTSAANASLIISLDTIGAAVLAVVLLREKIARSTFYGGAVAFAGVLLILSEDLHGFQLRPGSALFGDLLVLSAVFCWSGFTVASKKILSSVHALYAFFWINLGTLFSLGLVNLMCGNFSQLGRITQTTWLVTIYLGLCCNGLGTLLYYKALQLLPTSLVAASLTLTPVFGVALAVVMLDESLVWTQLAGSLMIVAALTYAMWPREE